MNLPEELVEERYCYLATTQRVTGRRHTAELWFVPATGGVYLFSGSGGLTTWCLNLQNDEQAVLRVGGRSWLTRAAFLAEDDRGRDDILAAFHDKYDPPGKSRLEAWRRNAAVVHLVLTREVT
ncbi:MAG: hypothetical protein ACRDUY_02595 [Nitriliruptorales bacterium]